VKERPFRIKAVLFDFDGTLTKPGAIDFAVIREAIGCPSGKPILEYIGKLPDPESRADALKTLDDFETEAAADSEPNVGAEALIRYLKGKNIPLGIISRNSRRSIQRALKNFNRVSESDFDLILSRDDPVKPKPSGDGIMLALKRLKAEPHELLLVGDFVFDIQAGNDAGALTVYLDNNGKSDASKIGSDFTVSDLYELKDLVRLGLPLSAGKLPNEFLGAFLGRMGLDDPAVIIPPGVGQDAAAVEVDAEEVLVLKSDPITFATDAIGHYAVLINANDIATTGARPRWLLTSLLFPSGTTASAVRSVMDELQTVCARWGITLCGGHTEITDAVVRPVVTGMLAGTVSRKDLIDKQGMKPGDRVLLTKAVAVEGTAIIAREFGSRLMSLGMPESEVEACKAFLPRISILTEAGIARAGQRVSAMHDVTEGGLATALTELSVAGRHRIKVDLERVPVYPETRKIGRLLNIDPLGLIGSGSLLICCREQYTQALMREIQAAGIQVTAIGEVLGPGEGVEARKKGLKTEWPRFEVDEITRLF